MPLPLFKLKSPIIDRFVNNVESFNLVVDKLVAYRYSMPEKMLTVYLTGSATPFFQIIKADEFAELDEDIMSFYTDRYGSCPTVVQLNTVSSQSRVVMDKITNYHYGYESQLLIIYTTSPLGTLAHPSHIDEFNDIDQVIDNFYTDRYGKT